MLDGVVRGHFFRWYEKGPVPEFLEPIYLVGHGRASGATDCLVELMQKLGREVQLRHLVMAE